MKRNLCMLAITRLNFRTMTAENSIDLLERRNRLMTTKRLKSELEGQTTKKQWVVLSNITFLGRKSRKVLVNLSLMIHLDSL